MGQSLVLTAACYVDNKQKDVIETAEIGAASLAKCWTFLDRYASCCIDRASCMLWHCRPDCQLVPHTVVMCTLVTEIQGVYLLFMHTLVMYIDNVM